MDAQKSFSIETGSRWFTVELRPDTKSYDRAQLVAEGFQHDDITEHDHRALISAVALAIRQGIETDPEFADFPLEWIHPTMDVHGDRWPDDDKILVTVVQGGSEGWHLEIYALTSNARLSDTTPPWTARRLISAKCFEKARMWRLAEKTSAWLGLM